MVARYRMGFVAAHLRAQVGLVIFRDLASDSGLHFAADSGGQVFANGVGHVFGSVVGDILGLIGDRTVLSGVGDIFCRLGDASAVGAIRYGAADERVGCIVEVLDNVDDTAAAYQGIFHLSSCLRRSAVLGIAGFDQLFRFVYGVVGVVDLGSIGNGGSEASGILVHHGGIGAVGYGGSDLICFLQVVGCIGSIRNICISLTGNGIDGGLLATINQLGFFFCSTAEVGSGLAISLAHFFRCLIGQLGGGIGTVIVGYLAYNGACRIGFYIQSFIRDLVPGGIVDIFSGEAAVASDNGSLAAADGIGLIAGNGIGLAAVYGVLFFTGHCGFQAAVVVFGLLAGHGFCACTFYIFALVSTDCGCQVRFEIFSYLSGYSSGQVSTYLVFHIAGYIIEELTANGVRHVTGCFVHQIFGAVGDGAAICIIGNAVSIHYTLYLAIIANLAGERFSGLLGVGLVCSVTSVGIESVIAQVGGGGVLPVGSGTLDARFCLVNDRFIGSFFDSLQNIFQVLGDVGLVILSISSTGNSRIGFAGSLGGCIAVFIRVNHFGSDIIAFYSQGTLVPVTICIGSFGPSGSAIFIVINSTFFFAAIFGACGFLVGGDFTGCHFRAGRYVVVPYNAVLGQVDFIHIQLAVDRQVAADGGITAGGNGFSTQVLHTGDVAILHSCRTIGDALTLDSAAGGQVTGNGGAACCESALDGSAGSRNGTACVDITHCGDVARGSYGAAGNGTAGVDVAIGDGSNPIGQGLAGYRSVAHGSTLTIGYCFTGDGCLGSDISVFIYSEGPVGPFDLAVSAHRCLGFAVGIAAGVDTVFIHHRAVGANLDSIFVQGNLVVLALVQDHFLGIGLGGGHVALGVNGSGVLLQNIVIAQAQSAIDSFHQFRICCHTGRSFCRNLIIQCRIGCCPFLGFLEICIVQSSESISHVLVDGIESIYHILVDLLNHLVLGFICSKAVGRFLCQGGVQVGHVFADGVGCFHDGPILYGGVVLAYIGIRCLVFQIFFHIGNPGVQSAQVLAHGISRLNRDPFSGCSIYDTIGSGDSARGNSITFDSSFIINSLRATFIMVGKSSSSIFCGCYLRIIRKIIS